MPFQRFPVGAGIARPCRTHHGFRPNLMRIRTLYRRTANGRPYIFFCFLFNLRKSCLYSASEVLIYEQ